MGTATAGPWRHLVTAAVIVSVAGSVVPAQENDEKLREQVLTAINRGRDYLVRTQKANGSWRDPLGRYPLGVTALSTLALLNCGMESSDPAVQRALNYLRNKPDPTQTYEVALVIMALVAAKETDRDESKIFRLAQALENGQIKTGGNAGSWDYSVERAFTGGDRSNGQFGVLGLRDAALAGYPVDRATWMRARRHWLSTQGFDGGWTYSGQGGSTGSMTAAGAATLAITRRMLRDDSDLNPDGTVNCCVRPEDDENLKRALQWLSNHWSVTSNPGQGRWTLYYLYALERAGRLTGVRFFGLHDWYRDGARALVSRQRAKGDWNGTSPEQEAVGTSLALLFLSKGLARVVVNKLEYGPPDPRNRGQVLGRDWENHPDDSTNLIELISGLKGWPRMLTTQTVNVHHLTPETGVAELLQAPVAYISGAERPAFTDGQVAMLRAYVDQGGFLLAVATCRDDAFGDGFRDLLKRMFPDGEGDLKRLRTDHPIFRSEYELDADSVELYGVDFGCRTPIIYSPDDLACHWNKWMKHPPAERPVPVKERIIRDTRVGVNIIAYATGREPPVKLHETAGPGRTGAQDRIERGLLQIAKLRHSGGWDTAPRALRNLLMALNETVGMAASTKTKSLPLISDEIFNHPLLYMHGRHAFHLNTQERDRLRDYLSRGHVLFADACCGSAAFDRSFRDLMKEIYGPGKLVRIPPTHDMFTTEVGHDIKEVERRVPLSGRSATLETMTEKGEPFLEGIEIDGRFAVIYSKYDISCALERQSTVACKGYVEKDAVRIAVNVVMYALLQDVTWRPRVLIP